MAPHASYRHAWISTGFKLWSIPQQLPVQYRQAANPTHQRALSLSSSIRQEERDTSSPIRAPSDKSELLRNEGVSGVDTSSETPSNDAGGRSKKPESLKDIFPDLFGNPKPLMAQSRNQGVKKQWEQALDDSMSDTTGMVDNFRRPNRPSKSPATPAAIGSTLSSIFNMGSNATPKTKNRLDPAVLGAKDRTRAAPKELQAFHELLESMFEATEAQAAEIGRQRRGFAEQQGYGTRRNDSSFGMERHGGPRDSYLSDAMLERRRPDRHESGDHVDEYDDRSRITTIAKPVGSMRNVSDEEMEAYMQKRELIASLRTDLDILEWVNRTYFTTKPATSSTAEGKDIDVATPPTFTASYPLVLAYTISVLHLRFRNPHAALAVFDTARSHSLESYLMGCTTSVYNEMLRARWEGLADLKGVEEGLEEMGRRGVGWDKETMRFASSLVENLVKLRLSVFSQNVESAPAGTPRAVSNDQRLVWAYGPDVFERLARLEEMVENQVEFSERGVRIQMKRRADEARDQEMNGGRGGHEYTRRDEGRGSFGGRSDSLV